MTAFKRPFLACEPVARSRTDIFIGGASNQLVAECTSAASSRSRVSSLVIRCRDGCSPKAASQKPIHTDSLNAAQRRCNFIRSNDQFTDETLQIIDQPFFI